MAEVLLKFYGKKWRNMSEFTNFYYLLQTSRVCSNTLTGANNVIEHFFSSSMERKICFVLT